MLVLMERLTVFIPLLLLFGMQAGQKSTPVEAVPSPVWETVIDSSSFANYTRFEQEWIYGYPWGNEHNGSARMYASATDHNHVSLQDGVLRLRATHITTDEGSSRHTPRLPIRYHSGAVYAKKTVTVSDEYPQYEVSGYFKAPVNLGTWPAFWLTATKGWPPETDILEFKGDSLNWQNTFIIPHQASTIKVAVPDAQTVWHHYKAVLKKVNATEIDLEYYFDHKPTGVHRCNFMNKPMWLIINLQMEGSSGEPGPKTETNYYSRGVLVRRAKA